MSMPAPEDRDVHPLGGEVAPPGDEESQGGGSGADEADDGVAGPSYPPAGTEPDAR